MRRRFIPQTEQIKPLYLLAARCRIARIALRKNASRAADGAKLASVTLKKFFSRRDCRCALIVACVAPPR
jgi:hypothetical protein